MKKKRPGKYREMRFNLGKLLFCEPWTDFMAGILVTVLQEPGLCNQCLKRNWW